MSKLPNIGPTIFSTMTQMANEHKAINLAQGFPDFPVDQQLTTLLNEVGQEGFHQYAPMVGNPNLLLAIQRMNQDRYGVLYQVEQEILVTAGAAQGIYTVVQALVSPGEEVVLLDPCYDCYEPAIIMSGAQPVHVALDDDYCPDWSAIRSAISDKTKMLIINNPHNPAGRCWSNEDFEQLEDICKRHPQLLVLSDEVYEYITFEKEFISLKTRAALRDRAIIVSSFGKTFHITGWKIGYVIAPAHCMVEIKKVHQFMVFSVNSIAQETLARYCAIADFDSISKMYQKKRDLFVAEMSASKFKLQPCEGSFFILADYSELSESVDTEFVKQLVHEAKVATIPTSVFSEHQRSDKVIRFCFAKQDETLIQAAKQLCQI